MSDGFEVHPLPFTDDGTIARFGLFRHGTLVGHVLQRVTAQEVYVGTVSYTQMKRVWTAETLDPPTDLGEFPSRAAALKVAKAAVS